jgi:hypothetical protein
VPEPGAEAVNGQEKDGHIGRREEGTTETAVHGGHAASDGGLAHATRHATWPPGPRVKSCAASGPARRVAIARSHPWPPPSRRTVTTTMRRGCASVIVLAVRGRYRSVQRSTQRGTGARCAALVSNGTKKGRGHVPSAGQLTASGRSPLPRGSHRRAFPSHQRRHSH